jgi:hypothetical protein
MDGARAESNSTGLTYGRNLQVTAGKSGSDTSQWVGGVSRNNMATKPPVGHGNVQVTGNPSSMGQYTFLKGGPGYYGGVKDPASREIPQSLSGDLNARIQRSKNINNKTQSQIRFNEKNWSSALPQVKGGAFSSDYHNSSRAHNQEAQNYLFYGAIAILLILVLRG